MAARFLPVVMLAQQSLAGGANLFALSRQACEEIDAERALSLTQFHATESPETETAPATLVRSETATDYALPPGIAATRILYHTRTANNVDAIASAVVLAPYGQPPGGGWSLPACLFTDSASRRVFQRLCSARARVQRNVYPGLGHDPVVDGSLRDQLN